MNYRVISEFQVRKLLALLAWQLAGGATGRGDRGDG